MYLSPMYLQRNYNIERDVEQNYAETTDNHAKCWFTRVGGRFDIL